MSGQAQLLPGTLDLLILKAVSLGPLHGYGVLLRIGQISDRALLIEQGALYPALFRLVHQGLLKASWGTSENNRRDGAGEPYVLPVFFAAHLAEHQPKLGRPICAH